MILALALGVVAAACGAVALALLATFVLELVHEARLARRNHRIVRGHGRAL